MKASIENNSHGVESTQLAPTSDSRNIKNLNVTASKEPAILQDDSKSEKARIISESESASDSNYRVYISKVGKIELLSRAREQEIGMQIEEARKQVLRSLFSLQIAMSKIMDIPKQIERGQRTLRQTINGSQTIEGEVAEDKLLRISNSCQEMKSIARARFRSHFVHSDVLVLWYLV